VSVSVPGGSVGSAPAGPAQSSSNDNDQRRSTPILHRNMGSSRAGKPAGFVMPSIATAPRSFSNPANSGTWRERLLLKNLPFVETFTIAHARASYKGTLRYRCHYRPRREVAGWRGRAEPRPVATRTSKSLVEQGLRPAAVTWSHQPRADQAATTWRHPPSPARPHTQADAARA
jgi:hypothetical protein